MLLLYRGESIEHSFDFSDLDTAKSPKSPKTRPAFPSSAQMLANAGMRPLVGELLPDLDSETDGVTNSSSSLKVESFGHNRGVEERLQATAALEEDPGTERMICDYLCSMLSPRNNALSYVLLICPI